MTQFSFRGVGKGILPSLIIILEFQCLLEDFSTSSGVTSTQTLLTNTQKCLKDFEKQFI